MMTASDVLWLSALSNLTKQGDYIDALLKAGVMVAVLQLATGLPDARREDKLS